MERSGLINYTSDAVIVERRRTLKAEGFKLEKVYDLTREQGSYNARIEELTRSGTVHRTLVSGAVSGEIYVKDQRRSSRVASDVDWDEPIEDVRGRVTNVLR